jgi:predicted amidohydrolase YtcJ
MQQAAIIIENARILTMDAAQPRAEAIAIGGNRILALGARSDVAPFRTPSTRIINAGGATVLPGLIESHMHLFQGAVQLDRLAIPGLTGASAIDAIRARAAAEPGNGLILVEQAAYDALGAGVALTRHALDAILPGRPLALMAGDHHTVWANTAALAATGLLDGRALPHGHEVVMAPDGRAAGELREFLAFEALLALTPTGGRESFGLMHGRAPAVAPGPVERASDAALLKRGLAHLARHGFTSFHAMDGDPYQYELVAGLEAEGALPLRARFPFRVLPGMDRTELALAEEWRARFASPLMSVDFIKIFMDGVIESRTAFMLADYDDAPGQRGEALFAQDEFDALCIEAERRGFQIAVHAIGDAAVRRTLDGYAAARRANGVGDRRHRIEHIETIDATDIPRLAELGVIASFQPTHAPSRHYPAEPLAALIGERRMATAFPWRTMRETGARICFSSDWPVVPVNPFEGIANALARPQWKSAPDQRQTLPETLASYTRDNAFAGFAEAQTGMLKQGMLADLVMLSGDIEAATPDEIEGFAAMLTICDGRVTFEA